MKYILPCECGVKHTVSTNDAGRQLTCTCGKELLVPSLMALRRLEPAVETADRSHHATNDLGHWSRLCRYLGVALGTLGIVCGVIIYQKNNPFLRDITSETTDQNLYEWWVFLRQGIDTPSTPQELGFSQHQQLWEMLFIGSAGLLVIGVALLVLGWILARKAAAK
ncbi:MAG: hypothetical protein PHE53_12420 [Thermoguttaceae bacterium]|nr:hypothetical protein [Thermoguttaceae bacterium]